MTAPDFSQGNLIYRAQLIEELTRIVCILDLEEMERELMRLLGKLKHDPTHLAI